MVFQVNFYIFSKCLYFLFYLCKDNVSTSQALRLFIRPLCKNAPAWRASIDTGTMAFEKKFFFSSEKYVDTSSGFCRL